MTADLRDTAHLVTGTLDTSGYGEGDLRDVALVYKDASTSPEASPAAAPEPDALTQEPLFTADGEPTQQALPVPGPLQIGDQILHADTGLVSEWNGTAWIELPPVDDQPAPQADTAQSSAEEPPSDTKDDPADTPPVEQTARAGKESKAPARATTRRGKAAG